MRYGADGSYSGITAASFGVVAAIAGLQFLSDVPKVRTDICQVRAILVSSEILVVQRGRFSKRNRYEEDL